MALSADELGAVLAGVRRLVRSEVVPAEDLIEETDSIPSNLRDRAAAMGLFGFALPEEYGGLGMNAVQEAHLAFELGWTTPAFRSMIGTNNAIAGQVIAQSGTDDQKRTYLPQMAAGILVASFALTEAEAGSDASNLKTVAQSTATGYSITGSKLYITNAPLAGLFVVFARTSEQTGASGVSAFLVESSHPGIAVGPRDKKMGQAGAWSAPVSFDDVQVPKQALLGEVEGQGMRAAMGSLNRGRLHVSALCVGLAERLLAESVEYAESRRQFGAPIADFQLVQGMLARSATGLHAARALVLSACLSFDDRSPDVIELAAATKLFCSEMVGEVADRAVQIHGGSGYMKGTAVERFYRDARLYRIYEGTSEIQQLVIAKALRKRLGAAAGTR